MKILVISRALPNNADTVAGIFVVDQARALTAQHDVDLRRVAATSIRSRPKPPDPIEAAHGIRHLSYFVPPGGRGRRLSLAASTLLLLARLRPDVVHLHWSVGLRGVVDAARVARIPVVVTEHGGPFPSTSKGSQRLVDPLRTLNGAAAVLPVSSWLRDVLADRGVRSTMRVVPNIVDPAVFHPSATPPTHPTAAVVARLEGHDKGIVEVLHATRLLRDRGVDLDVVIVGDGADRVQLESLCRELELGDRVRFAGTLARADVAITLRACSLLISASKGFETFGVAPAEALASGLPVVATSVGAIPELVRHDVNGYLVPESSAAAIADAVERLLARTWDASTIADQVRRLAPNVVAARLSEIYDQIT